ncbi:MAG: SprT-like domain-containing protein [Flavobacteriales bacterium]|nr:SprT-like domain-containing protein [Flavobacteriales bacterium]
MLVKKISKALADYLPQNTEAIVNQWLDKPYVELKIAKNRSSKLGDYRPLDRGTRHLISVNGSLNKYSFLLTLVHEIAHMHNFIRRRGSVKPHGEEWKEEFRFLMSSFEMDAVFPEDLVSSLQNYLKNPKASSSSDLQLSLALRNYDLADDRLVVLSDLKLNSPFSTRNGRKFIKGPKQRKRYKCKEIGSGRLYLFNPISEVLPL